MGTLFLGIFMNIRKPAFWLTFFPVLIVIVGLTGCAHYKGKKLNRMQPVAQEKREESIVAFSHTIFTKKDCYRLLDRDVVAKGYQPIQISLTNNTDRHIHFSLESFSFPCASVEEVAHVLHTNTTARAVGYGVAGLIVWPLIIPAIVDGIGSARSNDRLDMDLDHKGLRSQVIAPRATINGLIFVAVEDFDPDFSFSVTDLTTKQRYLLKTTASQAEVA